MIGDPNWNDTDLVKKTHQLNFVKTPFTFRQKVDFQKLEQTDIGQTHLF
jgi:hypothetical protein